MAKLLTTMGQLSGSIGGHTYSHNKGGQYIRRRSIPVNPTSTRQTLSRSRLATASAAWGALTPDQRASWNTYAEVHPVTDALGSSIQLSGQQAYVALSARCQAMGVASPPTAPATEIPTPPGTVVVTLTAPRTISVAFTPTLANGQRLVCRQCPPGTPGRDPNIRQSRLQFYGAANTTTPSTGTSDWAAAVGQVSNFYVAACTSAGQMGTFVKAQAVAA